MVPPSMWLYLSPVIALRSLTDFRSERNMLSSGTALGRLLKELALVAFVATDCLPRTVLVS